MVQWEMTNNGGYNTIDSVMHRETGYLVHSQTFMCKDVNGTQYNGAAFEMAEAAGEDLSFLDGNFDACAADDYQGHGLELEVYKFDYAGRYWNGPYFFWSELYQTYTSWDNIKARDYFILYGPYHMGHMIRLISYTRYDQTCCDS